MRPPEVVITGIGVISPIGIGKENVWEAYRAGRNGVGPIRLFDPAGLPVRIAGQVDDFDPKPYVQPRKNLKVMMRDAQFGVSASVLASRDARLNGGSVDPERFGAILGADRICGSVDESREPYSRCVVDGRFDFSRWGPEAMPVIFPLTFLRVLPNMIASHVSIVHDARGPNNTIHQGEVSSLLALSEAVRVIQRGAADVMIAGGASSMMNPFDWVCHCAVGRLSPRQDDPSTVIRPFDADRDGEVRGEGAAAFILENRRHAEARGAPILARLLGCASACEPYRSGRAIGREPADGDGLRRAIRLALEEAGLRAHQVGHVNAHGVSTISDDTIEARAIRDCVPNALVTAPKSYFGNIGAAGGAVEMVASVMSFHDGLVPATRNYQRPDPNCPVRVVAREPSEVSVPTALLLNFTRVGQAAAVVLGGPD